MTIMTVTSTYLEPPLLRATRRAATHRVPGSPEQAAQKFLANAPEYSQETPTHLRRWHKRSDGTWEVIDVTFTQDQELTLF